jgi:hypothetical protein
MAESGTPLQSFLKSFWQAAATSGEGVRAAARGGVVAGGAAGVGGGVAMDWAVWLERVGCEAWAAALEGGCAERGGAGGCADASGFCGSSGGGCGEKSGLGGCSDGAGFCGASDGGCAERAGLGGWSDCELWAAAPGVRSQPAASADNRSAFLFMEGNLDLL